jgi:hypothetical protein
LLIVAIAVFELNQGLVVAAVADPVNAVVAPEQTDKVPDIVGAATTVTLAVTVQLAEFLYVITAVPTVTPVTTPAEETVAIGVLPDVHGVVAFGVPEPVKVVLDPIHAVKIPDIVGFALIVTVAVAVQPTLFL